MADDVGLDARLKRIEEIVATLDSDTLNLDDALALFEEGVSHLGHAREMLARIELRVEELIGPEGDAMTAIGVREGGDEGGKGDG